MYSINMFFKDITNWIESLKTKEKNMKTLYSYIITLIYIHNIEFTKLNASLEVIMLIIEWV